MAGYTNKQRPPSPCKITDTDNRMTVIRGEGKWGEDEEDKGDHIYGDGRKLDQVLSTQ